MSSFLLLLSFSLFKYFLPLSELQFDSKMKTTMNLTQRKRSRKAKPPNLPVKSNMCYFYLEIKLLNNNRHSFISILYPLATFQC